MQGATCIAFLGNTRSGSGLCKMQGNAEKLTESKFEGSLQGIATTMESCKMYITGKALVVLC